VSNGELLSCGVVQKTLPFFVIKNIAIMQAVLLAAIYNFFIYVQHAPPPT